MSRRRFAAYFFALAACAISIFASAFFEPDAAADTLQYDEAFALSPISNFGHTPKPHLPKKAPAQVALAE